MPEIEPLSLEDLAELLSKSEVGSVELDQEIWLTLDLKGDFQLPYTTSMDAAFLLIPDGYDYLIGCTNGGLTIHAQVGSVKEDERFGHTIELAVCTAAISTRIPIYAAGYKTTIDDKADSYSVFAGPTWDLAELIEEALPDGKLNQDAFILELARSGSQDKELLIWDTRSEQWESFFECSNCHDGYATESGCVFCSQWPAG